MTNQSIHNAGNMGHGAPAFSFHYNRSTDYWSPIQSNEFYFNLSAGFISGMSADLIHGRNSDVDAPVDVWQGGGFYAGFPTGAAETLTISSTTNSDSSTGIGLRSLIVFGLDQDFRKIQETVNMSGTTNVTTSGLFKRVTKTFGETAGASGINLGTVTLRHTNTPANVFSIIPIGLGESQACVFTVPSGYKGYVDGMMGTIFDITSNKSVLALYSKQPGKSAKMKRPFSVSTESSLDLQSQIYLEFPEMTDLNMRVMSVVNNNADITASFYIITIEQ